MIVLTTDGMSATVTAGGGKLEPFLVRNGLNRGCTIVPTKTLIDGLPNRGVAIIMQLMNYVIESLHHFIGQQTSIMLFACCAVDCNSRFANP